MDVIDVHVYPSSDEDDGEIKQDNFVVWDEHEFYQRFRISKRLANIVLELVQNDIVTRTRWNHAVQPVTALLLTLRFLASGSMLIVAGDFVGVHKLSVRGEQAEMYRNRKGFFSYNVQAICDARLKIRDVVARWPGSVHDATIFSQSAIKNRLQNNPGALADSVLVADSGYANTNYCITKL
ncbi:hypothetical protein PPYR_10041 [Photinus pyralis]|uniref:DDE Tnp4 domain-containing protein n=1 Tax=Photinus pyralis TaxID=7054 RepID=A0A5N4AF70_PHOPY|nr:hypothetical protein PPYR_10041 [Photinus pyralis]